MEEQLIWGASLPQKTKPGQKMNDMFIPFVLVSLRYCTQTMGKFWQLTG